MGSKKILKRQERIVTDANIKKKTAASICGLTCEIVFRISSSLTNRSQTNMRIAPIAVLIKILTMFFMEIIYEVALFLLIIVHFTLYIVH